MQRAGDTAN